MTQGCIAAIHGRLNCIRQIARMCTPSLTGSLRPPESTFETASRTVQLFAQGLRSWQTDRQTTLLRL